METKQRHRFHGRGLLHQPTSNHSGNLVNTTNWTNDAPSATGYSGSLSFNGISSYVSVANASDWALPAEGDWSISWWVNFNQVGNTVFLAHDTGSGDIPKWDLGYWEKKRCQDPFKKGS